MPANGQTCPRSGNVGFGSKADSAALPDSGPRRVRPVVGPPGSSAVADPWWTGGLLPPGDPQGRRRGAIYTAATKLAAQWLWTREMRCVLPRVLYSN